MSDKERRLRELAVTMNRCAERWGHAAEEISRTGRVVLPGEFQTAVASGMEALFKAVALLAEFG